MNFEKTVLMDSNGRMIQIPFPWIEVIKYLEGKQSFDFTTSAIGNEIEKIISDFYKEGVLYLVPLEEKPIKLIYEK